MSYPFIKPTWVHAYTRHQCVTEGVIDILQTNFLNRRPLNQEIPHIDPNEAAVIIAESLEADRVINLPPAQMFDLFTSGPESDFKSTVAADLFFEMHNIAKENDSKGAPEYWSIAMASLEKVARTPTASPLLDYETIFTMLAQSTENVSYDESNFWYKACLRHNLHFEGGSNGPQILRDMADLALSKQDLGQGLRILTRLINRDPDDIWNYNLIAITFNEFGLIDLGMQAIQRGLELLAITGDPDDLQDQIEGCVLEMQNSKIRGREGLVEPPLLQAMQYALNADFNSGQNDPIKEVCYELVPDLDDVPLKRPLTPDLIPLPDRDEILRLLTQMHKPKKKTRRGRRSRRKSS